MSQPKICILRAPGTNCDAETAHAFEQAGGVAERVHLLRLLEQPDLLNGFQILCIPGGFSYGDDLGAGVIFAQKLARPLAETLREFLNRETLVLGICNGFQVLLKAGILPGEADTNGERTATLTWNENGKYTALWVRLRNESPQSVFLKGIEEIELPIAHAEGRLLLRDPSQLDRLAQAGQLALRYIPRQEAAPVPGSSEPLDYPDNPNGSIGNIAALSDPTGRVLGLMPHPERFIDAAQHPQWTRRGLSGTGGGLALFRNAVEYFV